MNQIDFSHGQLDADACDVHRTVEVHLADGEQFWLWCLPVALMKSPTVWPKNAISSVVSWVALVTSMMHAA